MNDIILEFFVHNWFLAPILLYFFYCYLKYVRYKKFQGLYGAKGGIVKVDYKFFLFDTIGSVPHIGINEFLITCDDDDGVPWISYCKLEAGNKMEGTYLWNYHNKGVADTGKHELYFSPDGSEVEIKTERSTRAPRKSSYRLWKFFQT